MAPVDKTRIHSRYEPYDIQASPHKAREAGGRKAPSNEPEINTGIATTTVVPTTEFSTHEISIVDSDSDSDSDIVELEKSSVKTTAHHEVIEVDDIASTADEDELEEEETGGELELERPLKAIVHREVIDVDEEFPDLGEDEEGDEDEDELDEEVEDWDTGVHLSFSEELDAVEKSMEGYDPEADPEYHEMKRRMEEDGSFEYLDAVLTGEVDAFDDRWF